jgi:hypothetical protein
MSRKAGRAVALLSSRSRVTGGRSRMILWLEVDCTWCKNNYAAGKRPGVTEHCLRGRPDKATKGWAISTRFNFLESESRINIVTIGVVNSPADGYSPLMISTPQGINATLYEQLSFKFVHSGHGRFGECGRRWPSKGEYRDFQC